MTAASTKCNWSRQKVAEILLYSYSEEMFGEKNFCPSADDGTEMQHEITCLFRDSPVMVGHYMKDNRSSSTFFPSPAFLCTCLINVDGAEGVELSGTSMLRLWNEQCCFRNEHVLSGLKAFDS